MEPGAPAAPEIEVAKKDYITVKWNPPKNNGGASIEGYWLEVQDTDNIRWRKVQRAPITKPPMAKCNYCLTDVMDGIEYRFRVAAVNAAGPGPMSEASEYALASDPIFAPNVPGKPDVDDATDASISISWSAPTKLGGTPLIGYVLEMMDEIGCKWHVASYQTDDDRKAKKEKAEADAKAAAEAKKAQDAKEGKTEEKGEDVSARKKAGKKNYDEDDIIKHTMFTADNLRKGYRYQFRVKAVHKAGESPFSFPTPPIECRELIEAPLITLDCGLKDQLEIPSGSTVRVNASIQARPAGTHKWVYEDGRELSKEAHVEATEDTSLLYIPNANRAHSGKYTLIAKNAGGVRQCACRILVLDTPSHPD